MPLWAFAVPLCASLSLSVRLCASLFASLCLSVPLCASQRLSAPACASQGARKHKKPKTRPVQPFSGSHNNWSVGPKREKPKPRHEDHLFREGRVQVVSDIKCLRSCLVLRVTMAAFVKQEPVAPKASARWCVLSRKHFDTHVQLVTGRALT